MTTKLKGCSMGWFGFWIFLTVYMIAEYDLYKMGNDTFFWRYKTVEEKQLQQKIIESYDKEKKHD